MLMPVWAQVFLATLPTATLLLSGIFWLTRRISQLEGQVAAILALLAAIAGVQRGNVTKGDSEISQRAPGR